MSSKKEGEVTVSEAKSIKAKGLGEFDLTMSAEGTMSELTTSNYQVTLDSESQVTITYDFEAVMDIENTGELEVKDPTVLSVEEIVE